MWFSQWKKLHDERVAIEEATECNLFVDKTWRYIQSLILALVAII